MDVRALRPLIKLNFFSSSIITNGGDTMSVAAHPSAIRASSFEVISIGLLSLLFFGYTSYDLGVWETWESLHAHLIEWMWTHETWMQVNIPLDDERVRSSAELAFGWWPSMLSVHWLAPKLPGLSPELALRLPSIILGSLNLTALYALMVAWQKRRLLALVSIGFLLVMPSFSLLTRHGLAAGGIGGLSCLLSALWFMHATLNPLRRYLFGGIIMMGVSAASLGVVGLVIPLTVYLSVQNRHETILQRGKKMGAWLLPILILVGIFYWRSWVKRLDDIEFWHLFFTLDPLTQPYHFSEWSGFQKILHTIGFNLFPFGAMLPIFAISLRTQDKEDYQIGHQMLWLFVVTFFTIALLTPLGGYWGGVSVILAAPMAIASAYYFLELREVERIPTLYTLSVILLWLLIDGNLKREPGLLIAALTGDKVEGLLPEFPLWRYGRYLSLLGVGILVTFHTSALAITWQKLKTWLTKPPYPRHNRNLLMISFLVGFLTILPHLITVMPKWIVSSGFMTAPFWRHSPHTLKVCTFALIMSVLSYHGLWVIWRLYAGKRQTKLFSILDLEFAVVLSWLVITPHYLDRLPMWRFMRPLIPLMEDRQTHSPKYMMVAFIHLAMIIGLFLTVLMFRKVYQNLILVRAASTIGMVKSWSLWRYSLFSKRSVQQKLMVCVWLLSLVGFTQLSLLKGFSESFSHQQIIRGYQAKMNSGDLQLYLVNDAKKSFYLSHLNQLSRKEFEQSSKQPKRHFYVVGREHLSRANQHYRKSTGEHIHILDNSHHKLLLASNQLLKGEVDENPINHAVIKELPKGSHKLEDPINFDHTIELVGWRLTPQRPRAGAPVKIDLFWRAKKSVRNQWKVFVHIDASGQRIHADHDPVSGVYPTQDWQAGDLIVDSHHITIKRTIKPAVFTFFTGLYRGKTRMKIKNQSKKLKDHDNRAILGKIQVL
jgi:hypothetical protein